MSATVKHEKAINEAVCQFQNFTGGFGDAEDETIIRKVIAAYQSALSTPSQAMDEGAAVAGFTIDQLKAAYIAGYAHGNSLSGSLEGDEEWEEYLSCVVLDEPIAMSAEELGEKRVRIAYAYCCGFSVKYCDCVNKNHRTALIGANEVEDDEVIVTSPSPKDDLASWLTEGPEIAKASGAFVEIKMTTKAGNVIKLSCGGKPQETGSENIACPCTTFDQGEECPVGYPSLLCSVCHGKGTAPTEAVVALAAEMMKIGEQVGELEDPFAAWESIDLIKSQNEKLRRALGKVADMIDTDDADLDDVIHIAREALATASEGSE